MAGIISSPYLIAGIILIVLIIWVCRSRIKGTRLFKKLAEFMKQFSEGLKSVKNMKNKRAFIGHSIFIWLMYYLMLYVVFFSFDFTSHLSAIARAYHLCTGQFRNGGPGTGGDRCMAFHDHRVAGFVWYCQVGWYCIRTACTQQYDRHAYHPGIACSDGSTVYQPSHRIIFVR